MEYFLSSALPLTSSVATLLSTRPFAALTLMLPCKKEAAVVAGVINYRQTVGGGVERQSFHWECHLRCLLNMKTDTSELLAVSCPGWQDYFPLGKRKEIFTLHNCRGHCMCHTACCGDGTPGTDLLRTPPLPRVHDGKVSRLSPSAPPLNPWRIRLPTQGSGRSVSQKDCQVHFL